MQNLWIIHRDPDQRAALARLAGASDSAILAGPGDPRLAAAPVPEIVLLGVDEDGEAELEFAHRHAARLAGARWILVPRPGDAERMTRLFDTIDRVVLPFPPDARALRRALGAPPPRPTGDPLPLSQRPVRDQLSERFARWFADIDLPELLRLLDPRLAEVPALICGEPGSGRGLLVRYIHAFGGNGAGRLVRVVCTPDSQPEHLLRQLGTSPSPRAAATGACVWLDDVDRLPEATQRQLAGWVEYGHPALAAERPRWIGTALSPDDGIAGDLRRLLGVFCIRIPPLRERIPLIAPFVTETAQSFSAARYERIRRFGEDAVAILEEYPWPGNLAELEAAVMQTLLTSSRSPIRADDLQLDDLAMAPLDAEAIGVRLDDEGEPAAIPVVEAVPEAGEPIEAAPDIPVVEAVPEAGEPIEAAPDIPVVEAVPEAGEPIEAAPAIPAAEWEAPEAPATSGGGLRRLAGAVAHEVRNPLTTIRNFTALLSKNYDDADFRSRFGELVDASVDRIETVVDELAELASGEPPAAEFVDVTRLLEELLTEQRSAISGRRLVVLKELERTDPFALGDPDQLRTSFGTLLRKCLELAPDRGDLYLASRHHPSGLRGKPSIRVLVRFSGPRVRAMGGTAPVPGVSPAENALEFAAVEAVARAHGGALAIQAGDGDESVVVVDLPAPR